MHGRAWHSWPEESRHHYRLAALDSRSLPSQALPCPCAIILTLRVLNAGKRQTSYTFTKLPYTASWHASGCLMDSPPPHVNWQTLQSTQSFQTSQVLTRNFEASEIRNSSRRPRNRRPPPAEQRHQTSAAACMTGAAGAPRRRPQAQGTRSLL